MGWKGWYKVGRDDTRLEEDDEQSFSRTGSGLELAILIEEKSSGNEICQVHHPQHGGDQLPHRGRWSQGQEQSQRSTITRKVMHFSNNNKNLLCSLGVPQLATNAKNMC